MAPVASTALAHLTSQKVQVGKYECTENVWKCSTESTPQQLETWKSTASWNEEMTWSSDSSGRASVKRHVRASGVLALRIEMGKWVFGKEKAIEKVAMLELHSKDKYLNTNHDTYRRLWDDFHELHDPNKPGQDNRRREGVSLREATLLYREVQTATKAGESEYNLRYPNPGLNRLDSDRRALRFILVKRWNVLLQLVRRLLPLDEYDPDNLEIEWDSDSD